MAGWQFPSVIFSTVATIKPEKKTVRVDFFGNLELDHILIVMKKSPSEGRGC